MPGKTFRSAKQTIGDFCLGNWIYADSEYGSGCRRMVNKMQKKAILNTIWMTFLLKKIWATQWMRKISIFCWTKKIVRRIVRMAYYSYGMNMFDKILTLLYTKESDIIFFLS